MAVKASVVSVGTSATSLSVDTGFSDKVGGQSVAISVPSGGATVYLGPSNVTTATGFPVADGTSMSVDLQDNEDLYGIVATGTQNVNVLRVGA